MGVKRRVFYEVITKNSLKTSAWKKDNDNQFLHSRSWEMRGRGAGSGTGRKRCLYSRDCRKSNVLMGKPDQENETLDNQVTC